jgi:hypothetical protein
MTCVHRDILSTTEPFTLLKYPISLADAYDNTQQ